jgi:hypothetical protein
MSPMAIGGTVLPFMKNTMWRLAWYVLSYRGWDAYFHMWVVDFRGP